MFEEKKLLPSFAFHDMVLIKEIYLLVIFFLTRILGLTCFGCQSFFVFNKKIYHLSRFYTLFFLYERNM